MRKQKLFLGWVIGCLLTTQLWAVQSQAEIKQLIINSQKYMSNGSYRLTDFVSYSGEKSTEWSDAGRAYLYNGIYCFSTDRPSGKSSKIVAMAPPTFGGYIWQSTANEPLEAFNNTILMYSTYGVGINTILQNMTLQKRLDSAVYTLNELSYNGKMCYQITAKYPPLTEVLDEVPLSHIYVYKLEDYFEKTYKEPTLLTTSEWFLPRNFIESNLDELSDSYMATISLLVSKDSESPLIYKILMMNSSGKIICGYSFNIEEYADAEKILSPINSAKKVQLEADNFATVYNTTYNPDIVAREKAKAEAKSNATKASTISSMKTLVYIALGVIGALLLIVIIVKIAKKK